MRAERPRPPGTSAGRAAPARRRRGGLGLGALLAVSVLAVATIPTAAGASERTAARLTATELTPGPASPTDPSPTGPSPTAHGPAAQAPAAQAPASTAATNGSYGIVDVLGRIATYGGGAFGGDAIGLTLHSPIVGAVAGADGYWMDAADGGVFAFGGAGFFGSMGGIPLNQPIVGMAATADGRGYWLVAADGGVFAFGDAGFFGSMGGIPLNQPIVGMAATADGRGYWMVAADGGVFAFGDAGFFGSLGALTLDSPVVGVAATHDGLGYLMVAADGGLFAFGDAPFYGSMGGQALSAPASALGLTPDGGGYWILGRDSAVYAFGDAQYQGGGTTIMLAPLYPAVVATTFEPAVGVLSLPQGPEWAQTGPVRVAFVGDSLGTQEGLYTAIGSPWFLDLNGAVPGCGMTSGSPMRMFADPAVVTPRVPACEHWVQQFSWVAHIFHADVIVLQAGFWEVQPTLVNGAYVSLDDPDYASAIAANLAQAVAILHSTGAQVVVNTAPFYGDGTPDWAVDDYNWLARSVATDDPSFVSTLDVNGVLCPSGTYQEYVNGVQARSTDGIHLTVAGVGLIDPAMIPLVSNVATRIRP